MKKSALLAFYLCLSLLVTAQKIIIEHSDKTPKPSVLEEGKFKVFLVNDTNAPISLFYSHHKEYGGCEISTEKRLDGEVIYSSSGWKPMDTNSRFDARAIVSVKPNSKRFIATLVINEKKPGKYLLKYRINQDPSSVNTNYAKNGEAVAKVKQITPMDIEGTFEYTIAALEKKPFEPLEISYEELLKKKTHKNFEEAAYDPSSIFAMSLTINSELEANEIFKKLAPLKNIRKLTLKINSKEKIKIPEAIGQLPLQEFSLTIYKDSRNLVAIPANFLSSGDLISVYIQGLTNEDLSFLGQHSQMEKLTLRECAINDLSWLGNLTNLTRLYLTESQIQVLPEGITKLLKLESITLKQNQLSAIDYLPAAPNLLSLELNENNISSLPKDLSKLTALRKINLSSNKLKEFPIGLTTIPNVENINLSKNQLAQLPKDFSKLSSLKEIDLSNNRFSSFPPVICKMQNLSTLRISNNQLTNVPKEIAQMSKLRNLYFENNQVTSIPPEFLEMRLYRIYSKGNQIEKKDRKKMEKTFGRKLKS